MLGTIFDIQRFSVHDGPGIRTTVFMKGCPLRCRWCHNPEGLLMIPQLQFFKEKCISCRRCGNRSLFSDAEKCPTEALTVCGHTVSEEEILGEILKDRIFYGETGGVTFSGGECLLQADFVSEVLSLAKGAGIHTAVDTCGYVPWSSIEKTLPFCDLYLYDIKCINPDKHKQYTGVDNTQILQNIKKLSQSDKEIWIRIPIIPDFNNSESEIEAIASFVSELKNITQVTLMPYHSLGASKYETLGLTYQFDTALKITEGELSFFKQIFIKKGLKVV